MLTIDDIVMDFPSEDGSTTRALDGFSLQIQDRELVVLMGPNGSGKSTVLRILDGQISPSAGSVLWSGKEKQGRNSRHRVAHVPQDPRALSFPDMSLQEHFLMSELSSSFARPWSRGLTRARRERYGDLLRRYEMATLLSFLPQPLRTLSGGWQQVFVVLAAAVGPTLQARGEIPDVTLLDEPTSSLDAKNTRVCMDLIRQLNEDGHTLLIATHQPQLVVDLKARLVVVNAGRVVNDLSSSDTAQLGIAEIHKMLIERN